MASHILISFCGVTKAFQTTESPEDLPHELIEAATLVVASRVEACKDRLGLFSPHLGYSTVAEILAFVNEVRDPRTINRPKRFNNGY